MLFQFESVRGEKMKHFANSHLMSSRTRDDQDIIISEQTYRQMYSFYYPEPVFTAMHGQVSSYCEGDLAYRTADGEIHLLN